MKKILSSIIISAIAASTFTASAQNRYITAGYLRGPVYDHRNISSMMDLNTTHGFYVEYLKETDGSKEWHATVKKPLLGYAVYYEDFRYDVLGKAVSAAIVSVFHTAQCNIVSLDINLQAGAAYVSRKFNSVDNYKNLFIGSKFSAFFRIAPELVWTPHQRINIITGLNFVHYSNGSMKMPNLGLNLAQFNLGARIRINSQPAQQATPPEYQPDKKWSFSSIISAGCREQGTPEGEKYLVTTFSTGARRNITRKFSAEAGFDVFRDASIHYSREDLSGSGLFYGGFHIAPALSFGKTSVSLELGSILFGKRYPRFDFYDRVSANYNITNRILAHVGLKTYLMKAEFIEWGVGYKI